MQQVLRQATDVQTEDLPAQPGWLVPIWSQDADGERVIIQIYFAAFSEADEAKEAVSRAARLLEGEEVGDAYPIQERTSNALGLMPGEVRLG